MTWIPISFSYVLRIEVLLFDCSIMLYCFPLLFIPFIWWLYQIRCTDSEVCTKSGVKVVVTDSIDDNRTDFYLFSPTFQSLARTNKTDQLLDMGAGLDVEYKRWAPNLKQITIISLTEFEATKCEYLYIYGLNVITLSHPSVNIHIFVYGLNIITVSHASIQGKICLSK